MRNTAPLDSFDTFTGTVLVEILSYASPDWCSADEYRTETKDKPASPVGIPPIVDLPLTKVNELMYGNSARTSRRTPSRHKK